MTLVDGVCSVGELKDVLDEVGIVGWKFVREEVGGSFVEDAVSV